MMDPLEFRQMVCNRLLDMRAKYQGFQDGFVDFDAYVAHIRLPSSWVFSLDSAGSSFLVEEADLDPERPFI